MVMPAVVGILDSTDTIRTYNFPGTIQERPAPGTPYPAAFCNITKQDYKIAPTYVCGDYWFHAWEPIKGKNLLCRARLLANNTIQLDTILMNLTFSNMVVQQITADYLTGNATGGHVYFSFTIGVPQNFMGAFKFTITGDNPLTVDTPVYFLFGQNGFPSARRTGGLALNGDHSRLSVIYEFQGGIGVIVVATATFAQVAESPLILTLAEDELPPYVGFRMETDVFDSSLNKYWQPFLGFDIVNSRVYVHAIDPDGMRICQGNYTQYQLTTNYYNHSIRADGVLAIIAVAPLGPSLLMFSLTPIGNGRYDPTVSYEPHAANIPMCFDVEKTTVKRYYGVREQNSKLRRWQGVADDVAVYTHPSGTCTYAVACVREVRIIPM